MDAVEAALRDERLALDVFDPTARDCREGRRKREVHTYIVPTKAQSACCPYAPQQARAPRRSRICIRLGTNSASHWRQHAVSGLSHAGLTIERGIRCNSHRTNEAQEPVRRNKGTASMRFSPQVRKNTKQQTTAEPLAACGSRASVTGSCECLNHAGKASLPSVGNISILAWKGYRRSLAVQGSSSFLGSSRERVPAP